MAAQAEFLGGALAGLPAPEIDGELSGDSDDGFLSRRAGGPRAGREEGEAFVDGWILRLEADHPPGQFDERTAQARVAMLGDGTGQAFGAAGVFAWAETGESSGAR